MFEHLGDVTAEPGGVDYIETDAGGVPALWAVPKGCTQDRVLLCSHGGGYVTGSMYTHRKVYGHLAKAIGCRALIVNYGRAPENAHPGPVNDMVKAYKWLLDQGIDPGHIALTGDSAGGGLAVTTILRAREQGLPLPAATMPISPWLDMEAGARLRNQQGAGCPGDARSHRGDGRRRSWARAVTGSIRWLIRCTPTCAALPPMYIQIGGDEALLDDSQDARRSGAEIGC